MEISSENISEPVMPTATPQSPSNQELPERSSKKTKRRRSELGTTSPIGSVSQVQDTPAENELLSPASAQWKTPDATPNQAWGRKDFNSTAYRDVDSDEESMDEEALDPCNPVIPITEEEKERIRRPWRKSLICKVLGRKVSYFYLLQRLQRMWKPESVFELIALDQDYFIAKFESLRDYEFAKYEGPWVILDHYLVVQEWEPNFDPSCNKTKKLLVWVRFPTLPVEYFEGKFVRKISRRVGRPVRVDFTTSLISKGMFARVCVEIDISKPLLSKFTLEEKVWPIEYEGIHLICFSCGLYGHR
ncbi:PREDICTED: uncharacterized protein LOC109167539 [Ipomoea nil]|uniref:uncharacterized protein LOC109167539 n=1 Tax=Ipomoea nil TaxID=35883 RepID=UPI000901CA4C|nr:PREDICTED: uncharacterized protein LOC109167539 [Ipomoea nil]